MGRDVHHTDAATPVRRPASPDPRVSKHRITRRRHDAGRTAPAARMGTRLRHRERGNAVLRHGTRAAVVGGVALTAGFGMLAFHTTQAHDAARAAAKARLLAYERHQSELQQATLARLRAQQQAAARAAQLAALRTAQANARARQLAVANAASAASAAAVASSAPVASSASSPSASAATPSSVATPAAVATPSASSSTPPVASSGGS
jgi:hypothetical protein